MLGRLPQCCIGQGFRHQAAEARLRGLLLLIRAGRRGGGAIVKWAAVGALPHAVVAIEAIDALGGDSAQPPLQVTDVGAVDLEAPVVATQRARDQSFLLDVLCVGELETGRGDTARHEVEGVSEDVAIGAVDLVRSTA